MKSEEKEYEIWRRRGLVPCLLPSFGGFCQEPGRPGGKAAGRDRGGGSAPESSGTARFTVYGGLGELLAVPLAV